MTTSDVCCEKGPLLMWLCYLQWIKCNALCLPECSCVLSTHTGPQHHGQGLLELWTNFESPNSNIYYLLWRDVWLFVACAEVWWLPLVLSCGEFVIYLKILYEVYFYIHRLEECVSHVFDACLYMCQCDWYSTQVNIIYIAESNAFTSKVLTVLYLTTNQFKKIGYL